MKVFLFLVLVVILFSGVERFKQLWQRVTQETFLWNYYEIGPLVKGGMSLKCFFFLFFSSGGHFVQRSETILAILVEGHPRNISVIFFFEIGPLVQEETSFKCFLIFSSVDHLASGAERF